MISMTIRAPAVVASKFLYNCRPCFVVHASKLAFSTFAHDLHDRPASPKVTELVEGISKLSLLETVDLVKYLKIKLNLQDMVMAMPTAAAAAATTVAAANTMPLANDAAAAAAKETAAAAAAEKTEFKVILEKYEASAKAKIIREIKNIIPGLNLVEAKSFVESVPKLVKDKLKKEEAEGLKKLLEELGGTVKLD